MTTGQPVNGSANFSEAPEARAARRTIPFEYSFQFELKGQPDLVHNRTVTVSVEAAFTAVSIGYGVVPEVTPIRFGFLPRPVLRTPPSVVPTGQPNTPPTPAQPPTVALTRFLRQPLWSALRGLEAIVPEIPGRVARRSGDATSSGGTTGEYSPELKELQARVQEIGPALFSTAVVSAAAERLGEEAELTAGAIGRRTADLLQNGVRINPIFFDEIARSLSGGGPLDPRILAEALEAVAAPPERIQFRYALFDDGTGREFQSEPILNTAGLGAADGRRPFRYFARPIEFGRRTTVRMQIVEVSGFKGALHVTLQGFKTLGEPGTPTGPRSRPRATRRRR